MEADIKWLTGVGVTVLTTLAGILVVAFRNLSARISNGNAAIYDKIAEGDQGLQTKIEDVKQRYVRRDDLDGHIQRLDMNIKELRNEQRDQHRQVMDALTTTLTRKN